MIINGELEVSYGGTPIHTSSIFDQDLNHEMNHPAIKGYPHDYGKPHMMLDDS